MKVFIGADHRGFELKNKLIEWLKAEGYEAQDCGAFSFEQTDDYPDFAKSVGDKVAADSNSRGIVICGSGAGIVVATNKINGVRCTLGLNSKQVSAGRTDDDINVLGIASDFTDFETSKEMIKAFLETDYDPAERHQRRLEKISALES
jgi:ribose 5-phosphate isomerase B